MPYRVSERADQDALEIWLRIARDNETAADRFLDYLTGKYAVLAEFPEMGRRRDDVRAGYRGLPVGDYTIFYVNDDEGIVIVHLTHGARRDLA